MIKTLAVCVLFLTLLSCSADDTDEAEKGRIEKATDKVATELVEKIQTPIEKARAVKTAEEQRADELKKQSQ